MDIADFKKLERRAEKLRVKTVANGCTPQEAASAAALIASIEAQPGYAQKRAYCERMSKLLSRVSGL